MDFSPILLARKKKSKMNRLVRKSPIIFLVSSPGERRKIKGLVIESPNRKIQILMQNWQSFWHGYYEKES